MTPKDQAVYDGHDGYMAHLVRAARMVDALPLDDMAAVTLQRMAVSGVYHRPGGATVSMTAARIHHHRRLIEAARAFVAAGRSIAEHPDALNPPPAGFITPAAI